MSTLSDGEMITALRFPVVARWGFAEFARRQGDFALVTAVVAEVDGAMHVALGGIGPVARRVEAAERVLAEGGSAREVARAAADEIDPTGDVHGSGRYRRSLAAEMVRRALTQVGID
jgi:carbon-monoxide dehydrogenase medium subunit